MRKKSSKYGKKDIVDDEDDKFLRIGTLIVRRRSLGGNENSLREREEEGVRKIGIDDF